MASGSKDRTEVAALEVVTVPVRLNDDDAREASSFEERVLHIADIINRGEWEGRPTAKRLAALWSVSRDAVNNYQRCAAVVCKADRGDMAAQRENAIGAWAMLREVALASGDVKAAVSAQTGQDKAAGVIERTAAVQVHIAQDPRIQALMGTVFRTLEQFPEARSAVVEAVRAELGGRRAMAALPARNDH